MLAEKRTSADLAHLLAAVLLAVLLAGCGASSSGSQPATPLLEVAPSTATLTPGGTQTFTATYQGVPVTGVAWSASAGTFTGEGVYAAPAQAGSYVIHATYAGRTGTATVTVALPGTPQTLYAAAAAACAGMPMRRTGVTHYFCDCQAGSETGCVAGDDARANAGDDTLDCADPASPCRTFAQANQVFGRMAGGDTIAFCKGGALEQNGNTVWANPRCAAAADMRAAANTTTCDLREYAPPWGGTHKPILRQTAASADMLRFWDTWTLGLRVLNLDFEGGGTGCGGTIVGRAVFEAASASDVLVCNNTITGWFLAANNNPSDERRNHGWDFYGNTVRLSALDAFLGSGDDITYQANYLEDNGSCTATSHVIYPAGNSHVQQENVRLRIVDNWIRFVNTTCQGPMISGHGTYDGVLIENNLIQTIGRSNAGCWGIGIAPDDGYDHVVQYERNFVIRRNRVEGAGWHLIGCASCPGVIVEDNVLVSSGAGPYSPLIAVPSARARTIQPDPITTGAIIRNNTIYAESARVKAIAVPDDLSEGSGHVIANNAVVLAEDGTCFSTPMTADAYAFVGNNACFGGTWGTTFDATSHLTADPLFTSAPGDLTLQAGSPLAGAGTPAHAAVTDFDLRARPSPPSIGAYEP